MSIPFDFLANLPVSFECPAVLSKYTTFHLGGPSPCVITCSSPDALHSTLEEFIAREIPYLLIGYGSNLLVSDKGLPMPVIRYFAESPAIERENNELLVSACSWLDDVVLYAAEEGLGGLIFASGIPGTLGGAIVGNAGAFGKQIGDVLIAVKIMSPRGQVTWIPAAELGFRYRHSRLKESQEVVLSARLKFNAAEPQKLLTERADILELRRSKHPDYLKTSTAGSFFRNIEPTSQADKRQAAGWFLEQAGAKHFTCGGAKLFDKHANIIIAAPGCTAQNVFDLSQAMANAVQDKFNLRLEREVVVLGEFHSVENS